MRRSFSIHGIGRTELHILHLKDDRGLHLDIACQWWTDGVVGEQRLVTLEAECARLVALGAVRVRLLPADDDNDSCIVTQDIEGNEFCLG